MAPTEQTIAVSSLWLDPINPRFPDGVANQTEAIAAMLGDSKSEREIITLARSIIEEGGLDPTQMIAVANEDGHKVVIEGNRRVTALKLLNKPSLAPSDAIQTRIEKLLREGMSAPSRVKAVVYDDRSEFATFQRLRHTGENSGAGLKPWRSNEIARFTERQTGTSQIHTALLAWCEREYAADSQMLALTQRIRTKRLTTLKRVLMKDIRPDLGLIFKGGKLTVEYSASQLRPFLYQLLTDILDGKTKQNQPWSRATLNDVRAYVQDTHKSLLPDPAHKNPAAASTAPTPVSHPNKDTTGQSKAPANNQEPISKEADTPQAENLGPAPVNTSTSNDLVDRLFSGLDFDQFGARVNAIGKQSQKISISANAEICGVLCRVVVDLACTEFLARHDQTVKEDKVWKRVVTSLKVLDPNVTDPKKCQRQDLHEAWKASDHGTQGLAIQRMNDFVHSILLRNAPSEVRHLNALFTPVLLAMERNLRQAPQPVATDNKTGQA